MAALNLFLGTIKAQGLLAPSVQKVLLHHCSVGRISEVAAVVVAALLEGGLRQVRMPIARGLLTADLRAEASATSEHLAEEYSRHGVLCAKGYLAPSSLGDLLYATWEQSFSSVLQHPENAMVVGADPDFGARSAVSAQALAHLLLKCERTSTGDLILPMKDLEGLCSLATAEMYQAFSQPDAAIHAALRPGDADE